MPVYERTVEISRTDGFVSNALEEMAGAFFTEPISKHKSKVRAKAIISKRMLRLLEIELRVSDICETHAPVVLITGFGELLLELSKSDSFKIELNPIPVDKCAICHRFEGFGLEGNLKPLEFSIPVSGKHPLDVFFDVEEPTNVHLPLTCNKCRHELAGCIASFFARHGYEKQSE